MNNKERLESYKRMYSYLLKQAEETNYAFQDEYPEFIELTEYLIRDLESYVKREQELFDVENHILWVDYRDYKFKIFLDAERNTLVGNVFLNNEIDVIGLESDSLTHLLTELERAVDNQINYRYQSQLAKEIIQHQNEIKQLEKEIERLEKEKKSEPMWTYCGD